MTAAAPSWSDFERAGWDTRAQAYHRFFAPLGEQVAGPVLDAAGVRSGSRMLDVCCGQGPVAGRAARRGARAVGIDLAPAMVRLAAARYPGVRFQVGDAEHLPYADGAFDAVICALGIHHLSRPDRALAEFARTVRHGGRVALTVWNDDDSALGIVKEAVAAADPVEPADLPPVPPRPAYHREDGVRPLLEAADLRLDAFRPVPFRQHYPDSPALWDGWLATAIRTGPLLAAQPEAVRRRARRIFAERVAPHVRPDGSVTLTGIVILIVAVKSSTRPAYAR